MIIALTSVIVNHTEVNPKTFAQRIFHMAKANFTEKSRLREQSVFFLAGAEGLGTGTFAHGEVHEFARRLNAADLQIKTQTSPRLTAPCTARRDFGVALYP